MPAWKILSIYTRYVKCLFAIKKKKKKNQTEGKQYTQTIRNKDQITCQLYSVLIYC